MAVLHRSIRILVANHPKLMRDAVLAAFADQPDIEIVGEVSDEAEIHDRVNQTLPDVLVVTLGDAEQRPAICDAVLKVHPEIQIIAFLPGQMTAFVIGPLPKLGPRTSSLRRKACSSPRGMIGDKFNVL